MPMPTAAGALGKRCRPSPGIRNSGDSTARALEQPRAATAPTPAGTWPGKERVQESRGTEQGAELGDAASPPAGVWGQGRCGCHSRRVTATLA